jgi:hypothetical protein
MQLAQLLLPSAQLILLTLDIELSKGSFGVPFFYSLEISLWLYLVLPQQIKRLQ